MISLLLYYGIFSCDYLFIMRCCVMSVLISPQHIKILDDNN